MSLQSRLFLFFTIIVMVPLGVAGFVAQRAVSNLLQERDRNRVTLATPGVLAVYGGRIGTMPDRVSTIAGDADFKRYLVTGDTAGLESLLRRAAGLGRVEHRLSFARQAYLIRCRKPR